LTEKWLFKPEAPGDGHGATAGIIEEELAGVGEIAEDEAQADPLIEETEAAAEAHEAEVWESGAWRRWTQFCKKYFSPFEASYALRNGLSFFYEYPSWY
jgi:hypothetical protein